MSYLCQPVKKKERRSVEEVRREERKWERRGECEEGECRGGRRKKRKRQH